MQYCTLKPALICLCILLLITDGKSEPTKSRKQSNAAITRKNSNKRRHGASFTSVALVTIMAGAAVGATVYTRKKFKKREQDKINNKKTASHLSKDTQQDALPSQIFKKSSMATGSTSYISQNGNKALDLEINTMSNDQSVQHEAQHKSNPSKQLRSAFFMCSGKNNKNSQKSNPDIPCISTTYPYDSEGHQLFRPDHTSTYSAKVKPSLRFEKDNNRNQTIAPVAMSATEKDDIPNDDAIAGQDDNLRNMSYTPTPKLQRNDVKNEDTA